MLLFFSFVPSFHSLSWLHNEITEINEITIYQLKIKVKYLLTHLYPDVSFLLTVLHYVGNSFFVDALQWNNRNTRLGKIIIYTSLFPNSCKRHREKKTTEERLYLEVNITRRSQMLVSAQISPSGILLQKRIASSVEPSWTHTQKFYFRCNRLSTCVFTESSDLGTSYFMKLVNELISPLFSILKKK